MKTAAVILSLFLVSPYLAPPEPQSAKKEFDALSRLNTAIGFQSDSGPNSKAIAERRFREIVSELPGTEGARLAQDALDGKKISKQPLPELPVENVAKTTAPQNATASSPTPAAQRASAPPVFVPLPVTQQSGGPVQVKGYTRKDGTYVAPYTRSAPTKGG